jgi:hypothetical protein
MDSFLSDTLLNPFQINMKERKNFIYLHAIHGLRVMYLSRFMIQILHNIPNVPEGKRHQKKETNKIFKLPN